MTENLTTLTDYCGHHCGTQNGVTAHCVCEECHSGKAITTFPSAEIKMALNAMYGKGIITEITIVDTDAVSAYPENIVLGEN